MGVSYRITVLCVSKSNFSRHTCFKYFIKAWYNFDLGIFLYCCLHKGHNRVERFEILFLPPHVLLRNWVSNAKDNWLLFL